VGILYNTLVQLRRFWEDEFAYHLTTTCRSGFRPFSNPANAEFVVGYLLEARRRDDILLLAYCVMPNHMHICCIPRKSDLTKFMMNLKRNISFHLKLGPIWERRFHDRRITSLDDLNNTIEYIHGNPVESGMTTEPENYRFSSVNSWETLDYRLVMEFGPDM